MDHRRAVLFDAAGTLIELREPVGETYARIAREYEVTVSPSKLEAAFRVTFKAAPAMAFPDVSLGEVPRLEKAWWCQVVSNTFRAAEPAAKFSDFDGFFENLFDVMGRPQTWREISGARSLLLRLRSLRWTTAIVSNFDRRLLEILQGLGLAELFDAVVLCSDVGAAKPDPAIFHHALDRLRVHASQAVVVGDDEALDIAGARAARIRAIHLRPLAKLDGLVDQLLALPDFPGERVGRVGGSNHGE